MRLRIINPNTTEAMTATIEVSVRAVAGPGTRVDAVTPATGPASIESHYDEALSVPGVLAEVARGEAEGVTDLGREALRRDSSDVLVLGCAGLADLAATVSARLGVPVVDGVAAATLLVQSLVTLGLRTSKHGEYAAPPAKAYKGSWA